MKRTKYPPINGYKKCIKCCCVQSLDEFYRRKETQGHIPYCKSCYRKNMNDKYELKKILKFPY